MDVSEAIANRRSTRGFLDKPVDIDLLRQILSKASRAPSGGNLQPWHICILGGQPLVELKSIMAKRVVEVPEGEKQEYFVYPKGMMAPYTERRVQFAVDLYEGCLGIKRDDMERRAKWFARNFQFFGAPLALFCSVDRIMGAPQWSDMGMYLQSVMLLLKEAGIDSCPQECWGIYTQTVSAFLELPANLMLFCGMAIGYADPHDPANGLVTRRASIAEFVTFKGV
jgi:nitroreductase